LLPIVVSTEVDSNPYKSILSGDILETAGTGLDGSRRIWTRTKGPAASTDLESFKEDLVRVTNACSPEYLSGEEAP